MVQFTRNWNELIDLSETLSHNKRDRYYRLTDIEFDGDMLLCPDGEWHEMSENAVKQYCKFVGVPPDFLLSVRSNNTTLSSDIMEYARIQTLKKDLNIRLLYRMNNGRVRAVLSDKYSRLDNTDVLEKAAEQFGGEADIRSHITADRVRVQVLFDQCRMKDPSGFSGDNLCGGVNIYNSEDGTMNWGVDPFIYRSICVNTAVLAANKGSVSRKHLNLSMSDVSRLMDRSEAVVLGQSKKWARTMSRMLKDRVTDPEKMIRRLCKRMRLGSRYADLVVKAYKVEESETRWGVFQAFTRAPNFIEDLDERNKRQAQAGNLLQSDSVWRAAA